MTERRRRGRPAGTQINDEAALAKIADLRVASPKMKLSAALRTVRMAGEHKGQSARAVEERWRTKFNARQAVLIEAAIKRRATKEARPTSGRAYQTDIGHAVSLLSLRNPLHDASSAGLNNALRDAVALARSNQLQDSINATMRSPLQDAMDALQRREAQHAVDQMQAACSQVGYGGMQETMRRIEEQRCLMDQIDITNRWLWPNR
jgi:hypothetical protein